jgi:hypothetical protein
MRASALVGAIADDLAAAELESLAKGGSAGRFANLAWRTLDSWSRSRRGVTGAMNARPHVEAPGPEPQRRGFLRRSATRDVTARA